MKRIFLTAVVAMIALASKAQVTFDYLKAADDYYKKGNYISAAEYYEKYLGKKSGVRQDAYDPYTVQSLTKEQRVAVSNKQQAVYNAAECYRLLNYYVKAEPYQQQATAFDKAKYPLSKYRYGKTLRSLEKFSEADSVFTSFLADYTVEDEYNKDAKRELANLKFREVQLAKSDLKLYTVNKANDGLNSDGASYAPVWMNNNTLLFTSTRGDSAAAKNKVHTNRVYQASYNNGVMGDISKVGLGESPNMHQGVVSITPNGNTIFVTRWMMTTEGKKAASIYSSNKTSGAWSEPTKLDSVINVTGYNAQEPFVMPNGRNILFSSNREGGFGGFDLWSAPLDANGNVGTPVNLGNTINTPNDERGPYYHAASNSLVFSSNGRVGMGGFDFYQSKGSIGSWGLVENLGYPLNSVKDDIYFVSKGKAKNILGDVVFSSDRSSACCLDLFTLNKIRPLKKISGSVMACDNNTPIAGANVTVYDNNGNKVVTQTTGTDGTYAFTLEDFAVLKAEAGADGFINNSVKIQTPADDDAAIQSFPPLCLTKPVVVVVSEVPKLDTLTALDIYFEFNKAVIKPESFVYLDSIILTNMNTFPTMKIEVGGHTDAVGNDAYNMTLSEARANAVRNYLISKGIAADRLTAVGYGETKPIAPNKIGRKDNPEGRKKNRRTEFRVLNY